MYLIPKYYKHSQHFEEAKSDNKDVSIFRWDEFIKKLKKEELHKINLFLEHFTDFLTNYWGIDKVVEFTNKEYNLMKGEKTMITDVSVPEMLEKLYEMIDETVESVKKAKTELFCDENYMYEIYFKEYDIYLYFGMHILLWKQNKPLILSIHEEEDIFQKLRNNNEELKLNVYEDDNDKFLYYNFNISEKVEIDKLKTELEDKIAIILQVLSSIKCAK